MSALRRMTIPIPGVYRPTIVKRFIKTRHLTSVWKGDKGTMVSYRHINHRKPRRDTLSDWNDWVKRCGAVREPD